MKMTPKVGNNFIQCDHMISLLIYHVVIIVIRLLLLANIHNYNHYESILTRPLTTLQYDALPYKYYYHTQLNDAVLSEIQ